MKTLQMYGETFEVIHPRRKVSEVYPTMWDYTDIYQAYQRPSDAKVSIWEYWYQFGDYAGKPFDTYHIGVPFISSRNGWAFTVEFNVYDADYNFIGYAHITRDHNRLYLA